MSEATQSTAPAGPSMRAGAQARQHDLTGRAQFLWNVLTSWGSYVIFIVAGFIMPRMIDTRLGQEALGVWDFCWTLLAYFGLVQAGITSSINVYIAGYRADGDLAGLNRAFSSVTCILSVMAGAVAILTIGTAFGLPWLFGNSLGAYVHEARWVVLLLGLSLAIEIEFSGFAGVLTGCHRWDLHNGIYAGTQALIMVGMLVVLLSGGGLIGLAAANFAGELVGRTLRSAMAYRVCPGLRFRTADASWTQARSMLGFGGKSFLPQLADLLINQTTSLLIAAYLGPAALAVFTRPKALVRHANTLVAKFAYVVAPSASAVHKTEGVAGVRQLFLNTSRYAAYITFPLVLALAILSRPLLTCWMGPAYAEQGATILIILALGSAATIVQSATRSLLVGINGHGRPGLADLSASGLAALLTILALGVMKGGLISVALGVVGPYLITNMIYIPIYACRRLGVSFREYVITTLGGPLLHAALFATGLLTTFLPIWHRPGIALLAGMACGGLVLGISHWHCTLPPEFKAALLMRIGLLRNVQETD